MRRFLIALFVLTILVTAQNVVAMMPVPVPSGLSLEIMDAADSTEARAADAKDVAQPMSLMLLLTGISGLTIAGGSRPARRPQPGSPTSMPSMLP